MFSAQKKGVSVLEILLAITMLAIFTTGLYVLQSLTARNLLTNERSAQATFYLQEGMEIVEVISQGDFNILDFGAYRLDKTGDEYTILTGSGDPEELPGGFTRSIEITPLERNFTLISQVGGGYFDYGSREITLTVNWMEGGEQKELIGKRLLTSWRGDAWTQTRQEDFVKGTLDNTRAIRTDHDPLEIPGNGAVWLEEGELVGTYTSDDFNSGSTTTEYLQFYVIANIPEGSDLKLQIRTAATKSGLSSATWVGPDGTNATFYDPIYTDAVLDPAATGVQYLQWKAYFTSDGTSLGPGLEHVIVVYE